MEEQPGRGPSTGGWNNFSTGKQSAILAAVAVPILLLLVIGFALSDEGATNAHDLLPPPLDVPGWTSEAFDVRPENETAGFLSGARRDHSHPDGIRFSITILVYNADDGARATFQERYASLGSIDGASEMESVGVGDQDAAWWNGQDSMLLFREDYVVAWLVYHDAGGGDWQADSALLAVEADNIIDRM